MTLQRFPLVVQQCARGHNPKGLQNKIHILIYKWVEIKCTTFLKYVV